MHFPTKPISIIAANSIGTPIDILARAIAPLMSKFLGQPVLVENKPGQGQRIGYEYVAKQAAADGYTIACVIVPTLAVLPVTVKHLDWDPVKDLPPLADIAESKFVFGSSRQLPWTSFEELTQYAKQAPNKLTYGAPTPNIRLATEALVR